MKRFLIFIGIVYGAMTIWHLIDKVSGQKKCECPVQVCVQKHESSKIKYEKGEFYLDKHGLFITYIDDVTDCCIKVSRIAKVIKCDKNGVTYRGGSRTVPKDFEDLEEWFHAKMTYKEVCNSIEKD